MDFQKLMIIFILIFVPLNIVLGAYIQNQIDSMELQSEYKRMLIDSTYDAINTYQMNTMSSTIAVGEDNKRYVLASVNTFFDSLAANMGVSGTDKRMLQNYVPAILFTNYDGYYIYSPTKMPIVATDKDGIGLVDGNDVKYIKEGNSSDSSIVDDSSETTTINSDGEAKMTYDYMVKPFVYYSATYSSSNIEGYSGKPYDVVINYSLDNYITVYGRVSNDDNGTSWTEFTKAGYLIDYSKVKLTGNIYMETYDSTKTGGRDPKASSHNVDSSYADGSYHGSTSYDILDVEKEILYNCITNYNEDYNKDTKKNKLSNENRLQTGDQIIEDSLKINPDSVKVEISVDGTDIDISDVSAKEYYLKSYFFSKWIYENLNMITINSIIKDIDSSASENYSDAIKLNFDSEDKLFEYDTNNKIPKENPEAKESVFNNHRRLVIQNSILYSLNSAISTYSHGNYDYTDNELPVLQESDWDKILNNISMTVFLQGMPCGTKRFNDYTTVTSTDNNQYADENTLYFTEEIGKPEETNYKDYHRIDCLELGNNTIDDYKADISAEFRYDARKVQVRCKKDINGWIYKDGCILSDISDTNTQGNIENPNSAEIIIDGDAKKLNDYMFYYDENSNIYYDLYWNEKTFADAEEETEFIESLREIDNSGGTKKYGNYYTIKDWETDEPMTVYLYDHKNTACYECIVTSNYTPCVKFDENRVLQRTRVTTDGELVIEKSRDSGEYKREDGTEVENKDFDTTLSAIDVTELDNRRKAWYIYIAKARNNLYKSNSYVNR